MNSRAPRAKVKWIDHLETIGLNYVKMKRICWVFALLSYSIEYEAIKMKTANTGEFVGRTKLQIIPRRNRNGQKM